MKGAVLLFAFLATECYCLEHGPRGHDIPSGPDDSNDDSSDGYDDDSGGDYWFLPPILFVLFCKLNLNQNVVFQEVLTH